MQQTRLKAADCIYAATYRITSLSKYVFEVHPDVDCLLAAVAMGPLGNLRHDSALMGALTNTKGKQALPERVPVSRRCGHVMHLHVYPSKFG